jgi:hypothetical protein
MALFKLAPWQEHFRLHLDAFVDVAAVAVAAVVVAVVVAFVAVINNNNNNFYSKISYSNTIIQ